MVLLNLCTHDENKRKMLDDGGVEALVSTAGSDDEEVVSLGKEVLQLLADLHKVDELRAKRNAFGLDGMLDFLRRAGTDESTRQLAIESVAEQLWMEKGKQTELALNGGVLIVLELVQSWRTETEQILLPALWALRNVTHEHPSNQSLVAEQGGIDLLLEVANQHRAPGQGYVLESSLSALVNLVVGHERNCRRLLKLGLDDLIDLAEGPPFAPPPLSELAGPAFEWDEALGKVEKERAIERRSMEMAEAHKSNQALATSLLQVLGPYNWVVCNNCRKKSFGGSTCADCGHSVAFG